MSAVRPVEPAAFVWDADSGPAARVRDIDRAAGCADGAPVLNESVQLHLANHGLAGARLWLGGGGFALVVGDALDLAVNPQSRGRGLGRELASLALTGVDREVTAWSHADHPAAAALAESFGVRRARELLVMARPAEEPLPDVPTPDGVRLRGYEPSDADALIAVNSAAFAHHLEQGGMDAEELAERTAEPWFDPAGLILAVDAEAGRLLGFHWTKLHPAEPGQPPVGEVYVVAVDPDSAGRGLGRLLTLAGLRHLNAARVGEVILYVEADNAPALAVYTRLGFSVRRTEVQYRGTPHPQAS